jgi:hypothetical protein
MEKCLRNGHHLRCERDADQVLECAILCHRMHGHYGWYENENMFKPNLPQWRAGYSLRKSQKYPEGDFNGCAYEDYMFNQDLERFCLLMKKYVRNWWD